MVVPPNRHGPWGGGGRDWLGWRRDVWGKSISPQQAKSKIEHTILDSGKKEKKKNKHRKVGRLGTGSHVLFFWLRGPGFFFGLRASTLRIRQGPILSEGIPARRGRITQDEARRAQLAVVTTCCRNKTREIMPFEVTQIADHFRPTVLRTDDFEATS